MKKEFINIIAANNAIRDFFIFVRAMSEEILYEDAQIIRYKINERFFNLNKDSLKLEIITYSGKTLYTIYDLQNVLKKSAINPIDWNPKDIWKYQFDLLIQTWLELHEKKYEFRP